MEYMFMPLKRYADFSGRSRRMEYWMWFLFQILLGIGFSVLMMVVGGAGLIGGGGPGAMMAAGGAVMILWGLYMLICLALLIPGIAVGVRRLHDTERTGWWLLAPVVPYVIMIVAGGAALSSGSPGAGAGAIVMICMAAAFGLGITLLVFMLLDGTKGPNKYGPDPKGRVDTEVFA